MRRPHISKSNDRALRIYNEVFGLERLHYGIWLSEDELTIKNLKEAQIRYEDYLVNSIPDGVEAILDIGCGTGVLTEKLLQSGFKVEGLSPDINQKKLFEQNLDAPFHHMGFEDFEKEDHFDCLIMSESCQYINIDKVFENSKRALKKDGYLMVCDYFVFNHASGVLKKSGHNLEEFLSKAKENNYRIVAEKDITDDVTKTLDLGKMLLDRALKGVEIVSERTREKYPRLVRFLLWLFRKKIEKGKKQLPLIDSEGFKKNKAYMFYLFQKQG